MLTRMQQRRGTQAEWNDSVIASTVILQAGELGLETDTGRFKIGNGTSVWQDLPYYLPDNNPASVAARIGKNNQDIYARLSPLAPTNSQDFIGTQVMKPGANNKIPLVVSGIAGQSVVLQRWRNIADETLASIDQNGLLFAKGGADFEGTVDVNGNKVTNVGAPEADGDAANKGYVDQAIAGLAWKEAVQLIAHGPGTNVALTGATNTLNIDTYGALNSSDNGYRIVLSSQTNPSENGIYVYNDNGTTYTLTRATDADTPAELIGASVYVQEGTRYSQTSWVQSNHYIDSFDDQTWAEFSGAALITAGNGLVKDGNKIDVVGTADRITANADSVDIASTYVGQTSITTLGTVTTGTWDATTIDETRGGTGQTSYAVGDILYADTTTSLNKLGPGTTGYPILSNGTGNAPSYGQVDTAGIANDAVTYDKIQNISAQYRLLGRISAGAGNTQEVNPDELIGFINQANAGGDNISFNLLPTSTSGGNNGTASTLARSDHTHTLDNLSDVVISGTPVQRQVIKYNGVNWINELPSGGISVGDTPPGDASEGDAWFDSTDGSLYVYYNDDVGSPSAQWVQVKANSALEASILTRVSALEARSTDIEAANAVRVANQAERNSVYPAPVQGNTVFRADLGYEEKYYAAYNATTNPDGTKGTPGWYQYRGGAPLSKNYLLNGDMEVNQRNLTSTPIQRQGTNPLHFGADRWKPYDDYESRYSLTSISDSSVPARFATRLNSTTTSYAYPSEMSFGQKIESIDAIPLRGKTVTLSFYIRFSNATFTSSIGGNPYNNFRYELGYYTSTTDSSFILAGGSNTPNSYTFETITNGSLPTTWTRVFLTGVVPSNANNIHAGLKFESAGFTSSFDTLWYEVTGVQLEEGPVPTPFRRNQPNIQAELAACQRYYYRVNATGANSTFGMGMVTGTATESRVAIYHPVHMRIAPSAVEWNNLTITNEDAINTAVSAISQLSADIHSSKLAVTHALGHIKNTSIVLRATGSPAHIGFNAEL